MEPKLAMLFAMVGVIIALSHLDDDRITRVMIRTFARTMVRIWRRLAFWRRRRPAAPSLKS